MALPQEAVSQPGWVEYANQKVNDMIANIGGWLDNMTAALRNDTGRIDIGLGANKLGGLMASTAPSVDQLSSPITPSQGSSSDIRKSVGPEIMKAQGQAIGAVGGVQMAMQSADINPADIGGFPPLATPGMGMGMGQGRGGMSL